MTGHKESPRTATTYELLDSGDGVKIEQLGPQVLQRPSSWCVWSLSGKVAPSAVYDPKREGWSADFSPWRVDFHLPELKSPIAMEARLQRNGQIGIFPEHASYLPDVIKDLRMRANPTVLNLFAFTGLASMAAIKAGASVTHVDILKPVLDWARRNGELNEVAPGTLRLIPEEAVTFVQREQRRGNRYDMVILDPPSFSRIAKGKDWELDGVLRELLAGCLALLSPAGALYFTCHHGTLAGAIVENLILEIERDPARGTLHSQPLSLTETGRRRNIPAGFLTVYRRG